MVPLTDVVGSEAYCAPEVWTGNGYSFACDLWSCGVVLVAMLFKLFPMQQAGWARFASACFHRRARFARFACRAQLSPDMPAAPASVVAPASPISPTTHAVYVVRFAKVAVGRRCPTVIGPQATRRDWRYRRLEQLQKMGRHATASIILGWCVAAPTQTHA